MSETDTDAWALKINNARTRRERCENEWQLYARLHTHAYRALRDKNEDQNVTLPSGDQVKIGLVHRNLEQTFAMLDIPEVSIKATAQDFTRAMGSDDAHREALVEYAIRSSLYGGGIMGQGDVCDAVTRDAVMIGHGITYTWWRTEEAEVPGEPALQMVEQPDGSFVPATDESGQDLYARPTRRQVIYEAVQDDYVSPLEFLFDASAFSMWSASWHGREAITTLDALRARGFDVPEGIKPSAIRRKSLYGEDPQTDESLEEDSVRHITIWDKRRRELIDFIESSEFTQQAGRRRRGEKSVQSKLYELRRQQWPVTFDHPDKSPFSFLIPIPANDQPFGVSQVESIRVLGLEADKLRTRAANLTREQKLLVLFRMGSISQEEMDAAMKSPDGAAVGVKVPEDAKWDDLIKTIQSTAVPRDLYTQIAQAVNDVDQNTGVSAVAQGGAETATESDRIFTIGSARITRKRNLKLRFIGQVAETHRCLLREFAPGGQSIVVPDEIGAPQMLTYGREAFQGRFEIQAMAGESGMTPVRQKFLSDMFGQLFQKFGPQFDLALLRNSLTMFDVKGMEALMRAARAGAQLPGMTPGAMPGLPGAAAPNAALPSASPQNFNSGQALRSAINAITESRGGRP